ncbi:MAG: DEAD/DEAH box helicase family protein [Alphaproteobacteria bacterium]|nr:DEAD/DEAH box helicase family protein [Alphaproteobacteria bacterium]
MTETDDQIVNEIIKRLSLRRPQSEALKIFAEWQGESDKPGNNDNAHKMQIAFGISKRQGHEPLFTDFEHSFPSLCFALATGTGKTRLMGAFILFLFLTKRSRNFFIIAPGTTIYKKLICDFSEGTEKYVFKGMSSSTLRHELVHNDNYKSRGSIDYDRDGLKINIFNIDLINKEERENAKLQFKAMQETIGESYHAYLAQQKDLVVILDEAHRYRAKAGMRAIESLRPMLGLELTATPKIIPKQAGAKAQDFKNIIYRYALAEALRDQIIKVPSVATRTDFNPNSVTETRLQEIKLEDAVHYHDNVAAAAFQYWSNYPTTKRVHPFILVVAKDTGHARELREWMESEAFFASRFSGRILEIHSKLAGEESEENEAKLIDLEKNDKYEIVIHVNKLREGWDVNNLFTIVPLRASASEVLTEQTLGRGLRLPFGRRIAEGNEDSDYRLLDELCIIDHKNFDEIIARAKDEHSFLKQRLIGDRGDVGTQPPKMVESRPRAAKYFAPGMAERGDNSYIAETPENRAFSQKLFEKIANNEIDTTDFADAIITPTVDPDSPMPFSPLPQISEDYAQKIHEEFIKTTPLYRNSRAIPKELGVRLVKDMLSIIAKDYIPIPKVRTVRVKRSDSKIEPFELNNLRQIDYRPLADSMVKRNLETQEDRTIAIEILNQNPATPESLILEKFRTFDSINYDENADVINGLVMQVTGHLASYLKDSQAIINVCQNFGEKIAKIICKQIMERMNSPSTHDFEMVVERTQLDLTVIILPQQANYPKRDYKLPAEELSDTRKYIFSGFSKGCYDMVKFDSDSERKLAVILERDNDVKKWLRVSERLFTIAYRIGYGTRDYSPDFIVETSDGFVIVEVKAHNQTDTEEVMSKQQAALQWVDAVNRAEVSKKSWHYRIVKDCDLRENSSFAHLVNDG